jgi:hypothetical protein
MLQDAIKQLLNANKNRGQKVAKALVLDKTISPESEKHVAKVVRDLLNSGLDEVNNETDEE